jgi:hypothetical protein
MQKVASTSTVIVQACSRLFDRNLPNVASFSTVCELSLLLLSVEDLKDKNFQLAWYKFEAGTLIAL